MYRKCKEHAIDPVPALAASVYVMEILNYPAQGLHGAGFMIFPVATTIGIGTGFI